MTIQRRKRQDLGMSSIKSCPIRSTWFPALEKADLMWLCQSFLNFRRTRRTRNQPDSYGLSQKWRESNKSSNLIFIWKSSRLRSRKRRQSLFTKFFWRKMLKGGKRIVRHLLRATKQCLSRSASTSVIRKRRGRTLYAMRTLTRLWWHSSVRATSHGGSWFPALRWWWSETNTKERWG